MGDGYITPNNCHSSKDRHSNQRERRGPLTAAVSNPKQRQCLLKTCVVRAHQCLPLQQESKVLPHPHLL